MNGFSRFGTNLGERSGVQMFLGYELKLRGRRSAHGSFEFTAFLHKAPGVQKRAGGRFTGQPPADHRACFMLVGRSGRSPALPYPADKRYHRQISRRKSSLFSAGMPNCQAGEGQSRHAVSVFAVRIISEKLQLTTSRGKAWVDRKPRDSVREPAHAGWRIGRSGQNKSPISVSRIRRNVHLVVHRMEAHHDVRSRAIRMASVVRNRIS